MNEYKVIVAVDDKDEELFKNHRSNSLKDFLGDKAELNDDGNVKLTNFKTLNDKFVKCPQLMKLSECQGHKLLVQSPLYTNRYYLMENFDEEYRKDLDDIMYKLACRMGASLYKSQFKEKKVEAKRVGVVSKFKALFTNTQAQGNGELELKSVISNSKESHQDDSFERITEPKHYPTNKLRQFIDEECINIDGLPEKFKDEVKRYCEKGDNSGGCFHKTETINKISQKITEFNFNLSAKVNANQDFLAEEFGGFKNLTEFKYVSSIEYKIQFAPKPKSEFFKFGD